MALLEQDHAYEIADAILAASPADETEVSIECVEDRFVRFGHEGPTQSADRERYELAVRARYRASNGGFREARASAGALDEASAFGALARADVLARIASPNADAVQLGGPVEVEGTSPSRPTQDHTFREKAEWIESALDTAERDELCAAGLARTTVASRSLVNSEGRRVHGATSRAEFSITCATRGADAETHGGAAASSSIACFVDRVDVEGVVRDATEAALRGRDPGDHVPRPTRVVLAPAAVSALLAHAAELGFGAQAFSDGASFLAGRVGERALSPALDLTDDPTHPALRSWRFDGEGSPRSRTPLVQAGELLGPVTDARWAPRLGLANTGHGLPQPSASGPRADHLVVAAGDRSEAELIAEVGDGLYLRQLHYVNVMEPKSLLLTGMTRGGAFRIEGGVLGKPVRNLRFTHSLVDLLGAVIGVGDDPRRQGSLMAGEVVAPALAVRDFRFTSASA